MVLKWLPAVQNGSPLCFQDRFPTLQAAKMAALWRIFAGRWVFSPLEWIEPVSVHFNGLFCFARQCFRKTAIFAERINIILRGTTVPQDNAIAFPVPSWCFQKLLEARSRKAPQGGIKLDSKQNLVESGDVRGHDCGELWVGQLALVKQPTSPCNWGTSSVSYIQMETYWKDGTSQKCWLRIYLWRHWDPLQWGVALGFRPWFPGKWGSRHTNTCFCWHRLRVIKAHTMT